MAGMAAMAVIWGVLSVLITILTAGLGCICALFTMPAIFTPAVGLAFNPTCPMCKLPIKKTRRQVESR